MKTSTCDYNSTLDGITIVRHFAPSCCNRCKHFDGADKGTCAAYPNGIPSRFADMVIGGTAPKQEIHTKVETDQVGNFVCEFE